MDNGETETRIIQNLVTIRHDLVCLTLLEETTGFENSQNEPWIRKITLFPKLTIKYQWITDMSRLYVVTSDSSWNECMQHYIIIIIWSVSLKLAFKAETHCWSYREQGTEYKQMKWPDLDSTNYKFMIKISLIFPPRESNGTTV